MRGNNIVQCIFVGRERDLWPQIKCKRTKKRRRIIENTDRDRLNARSIESLYFSLGDVIAHKIIDWDRLVRRELKVSFGIPRFKNHFLTDKNFGA